MASSKIAYGIEIPQVFLDGPVDMEHIRNFVRRAEELGYESLWTQERIISDFCMLEPVALMTYVAALTSRIRIGSSVLLTVLRNPVQLAKSLSTLDRMSGGRLTVGVGLGGAVGRFIPESESVFGYPSERRVTRFVEGIKVMQRLWTQNRASFDGVFWRFADIPMEPKPWQKPLPVWFGGHAEAALKRAVAMGQGWMGAGSSSTDRFIEEYARIARFLDETGRDPARFAISKRVYMAVDTNRNRAEARLREFFAVRYKNAELASQVAIWGGRQEIIDKLGELTRAGARHLVLNPVFDEMEHLELLAAEVVPHLT